MVRNQQQKVNLKQVYGSEILKQLRRFLDYPTTSSQKYIGDFTRKLNENDNSFHGPYPNEKYTYIKKLGDGSASKLYIAKDKENDKQVVIKKINKKEEWRNELAILKLLKGSPKVLQYLDFFENFRIAYIVTEHIDGFDLFDHIDLNVPYEEYYAKQIIREMLECIKICHDRNIAHLDIKCENFMSIEMKPKPKLILIDFGHAEKISPGIVKKGETNYGTCFYLCPEGYQKFYSSKSDIWSIGICTYLIIYGDYPFKGDDDEYAHNVCKGKIKFTSKLNQNNQLQDFIYKCLNYNPYNRATVDELLAHQWINSNGHK